MKITKARWASNGDNFSISMPMSKVNEEKRLVSGFASLDNPDTQSDVVKATASAKAFSRFRGNIREMHQPIAVGKMIDYREEEFLDPKTNELHKGVFVTVYVSKGAQDTWEKVLDGTLTGFSIGGNILEADTTFDKAAGKAIRVIEDYELVELSLVDNPANQKANILSVQKVNGGPDIIKGMIVDTKSEITYYCDTDEIAKTSTESSLDCPNCGESMTNAGWFEYSTDAERTAKMSQTVHEYLTSINKTQGEPAIHEGGVDVAEDTVNKEKPLDGEIEAVEQGQAETEVEASVNAEETDLKDAEVTEVEPAAETEVAADVSEVDNADDDIAKMITELNSKIVDSLEKGQEKNREVIEKALTDVNEKFEKFQTEFADKYDELAKNHGELKNKFASIEENMGKMEKSLGTLQDASAVRKSGDLGGDSETVVAKAATGTWGGHFLGVNSLNDK